MLMTEEKANTKRCPLPMGTMHDQRTQNHCIASNCMAWRWGQTPRETMRNYHDAPVVQPMRPIAGIRTYDYPDGWQYEHTDTDQNGRKFDLLHRLPADDAPRAGYCGAFGKPEC